MVRENIPGADHPDTKVLIFDHVLRTGGDELRLNQKNQPESGWGLYAGVVHTDATVRSIHTRAKDQIMGTTETEVKYKGEYPACWYLKQSVRL